eukprot:CAMPEP_0197237752 /NCGR_PEP_ID=MMETSP1429-20130617/4498_1 /TAXON_ID=49237 /ORGANISM="Chaetoceros  sp., Strain UNC1202" /LENGTH=65 /DNA_ID=CAMNT_0042696813 /DNA_START=66 /DNA_END=259 /DNA_ORIENTATION=-
MTFLPSSVSHLKNKQGTVKIELERMGKLQRLPYDIGRLQNIVTLVIEIRQPNLSDSLLPWTIGRL